MRGVKKNGEPMVHRLEGWNTVVFQRGLEVAGAREALGVSPTDDVCVDVILGEGHVLIVQAASGGGLSCRKAVVSAAGRRLLP